jgi:hypothetical protein
MRLVVAGIGVADRGDHSMINSDLDRLSRTPPLRGAGDDLDHVTPGFSTGGYAAPLDRDRDCRTLVGAIELL